MMTAGLGLRTHQLGNAGFILHLLFAVQQKPYELFCSYSLCIEIHIPCHLPPPLLAAGCLFLPTHCLFIK